LTPSVDHPPDPLHPQNQDETVSGGGSPREASLRLVNSPRLPDAQRPFSTRLYNPLLNMHLISMRRPSCVHLLGENPETRDNRDQGDAARPRAHHVRIPR